MKTILTLLTIITVLVSLNGMAAADVLKPKTVNGVSYVSGGVGMDDQKLFAKYHGATT